MTEPEPYKTNVGRCQQTDLVWSLSPLGNARLHTTYANHPNSHSVSSLRPTSSHLREESEYYLGRKQFIDDNIELIFKVQDVAVLDLYLQLRLCIYKKTLLSIRLITLNLRE